MRVSFCYEDSGEERYGIDVENIEKIMPIIKSGLEVNLYRDNEDYLNGYVSEIRLDIDENDNEIRLNVFITETFRESTEYKVLRSLEDIKERLRDLE